MANRSLERASLEIHSGIVALQKRMIYRYDNSYILDSSDKYPDLFSAVVILDAEDAGTPVLVRRYTRENGLAGVRLFGGRKADGSMPWLNSPNAQKTWDVAQDQRLVMDLEFLSAGGAARSLPATRTATPEAASPPLATHAEQALHRACWHNLSLISRLFESDA